MFASPSNNGNIYKFYTIISTLLFKLFYNVLEELKRVKMSNLDKVYETGLLDILNYSGTKPAKL